MTDNQHDPIDDDHDGRDGRDGLSATIAQTVRQVIDRTPAMSVADAIRAIPAGRISTFWHAAIDHAGDLEHATTALGASPGAASGEIVLTAEAAIDAAAAGRSVILVRPETTPDDVLGMQSSRGILTARGGVSSHAAVVARGWGIPAVVGASELVVAGDHVRIGDRVLRAGDHLSIDGSTGSVFVGRADISAADAPAELETLLAWADRVRDAADRPVSVRANADLADDARHGRRLGAEGIGLCRTEHMFLAEDRLGLMRRFILTDDPRIEAETMAELEVAQQRDFEGLLAAMDGLPVTVRLLDPPLHEFLPEIEHLVVHEALGTLDGDGARELAAVRRMHEVNPMIGTRGVRLGVVRPGIYQMQVRALCRAVASVTAGGGSPQVEIMIPLVVDPAEMQLARTWVDEAVAEVGLDADAARALSVGTMIETPRAMLLGGELAEVADFFSFGTNDLTQLMFGFSRDDVGSTLVPTYLAGGLLDADPFETLDRIGVGRGIRFAADQARTVRAGIKLGVCGEQAGDPESVAFFVDCGIDYVSCSPYRLPVARLAVAQALLAQGRVSADRLEQLDRDVRSPRPAAPTGTPAAEPSDASDSHDTSDAVGDHEFAVLHALRIKGFTTAADAAHIAHLDPGTVEAALAGFAPSGLVRHIEARDLWQLTPAGTERHGELLLEQASVCAGELRPHYDEFLALNVEFKDLCASWQLRDGQPNDHADADYDRARIEELAGLHARAEPVVAGFANGVGRFENYRHRLGVAMRRLADGETRMFTGLMCGSYHEVWMELHEDLIQLLRIDRQAEGSF